MIKMKKGRERKEGKERKSLLSLNSLLSLLSLNKIWLQKGSKLCNNPLPRTFYTLHKSAQKMLRRNIFDRLATTLPPGKKERVRTQILAQIAGKKLVTIADRCRRNPARHIGTRQTVLQRIRSSRTDRILAEEKVSLTPSFLSLQHIRNLNNQFGHFKITSGQYLLIL